MTEFVVILPDQPTAAVLPERAPRLLTAVPDAPTPAAAALPDGAPQIAAAPPAPTGAIVLPVPGPQGQPGEDASLSAADLARVIEAAVPAAVDATSGEIRTHIAAPDPHPAYDDLPSLRLLFENGLV